MRVMTHRAGSFTRLRFQKETPWGSCSACSCLKIFNDFFSVNFGFINEIPWDSRYVLGIGASCSSTSRGWELSVVLSNPHPFSVGSGPHRVYWLSYGWASLRVCTHESLHLKKSDIKQQIKIPMKDQERSFMLFWKRNPTFLFYTLQIMVWPWHFLDLTYPLPGNLQSILILDS